MSPRVDIQRLLHDCVGRQSRRGVEGAAEAAESTKAAGLARFGRRRAEKRREAPSSTGGGSMSRVARERSERELLGFWCVFLSFWGTFGLLLTQLTLVVRPG